MRPIRIPLTFTKVGSRMKNDTLVTTGGRVGGGLNFKKKDVMGACCFVF